MKPKHLKDYTQLAIETYEKAKWEHYGFQKKYSNNPTKALNTWLGIGWGLLFQRKLSDSEVQLLKLWIQRRKEAEAYCANDKDTFSHRIRAQSEYIGADGFIYMRKIIPTPPNHHPIETKRIEDIIKELKIINGANRGN
tara:strand:+ start:342 stop:758 length:417 start_codon:yes stop_codon:yes gene_type:complete